MKYIVLILMAAALAGCTLIASKSAQGSSETFDVTPTTSTTATATLPSA